LVNGAFQASVYDPDFGWEPTLVLGAGRAFLVCHNATVTSPGLGFYCATRTQTTQIAGSADDFTGADEPAQPSTGLKLYLQNLSPSLPARNFDNCGTPSALIHTFSNLPDCLSSARLLGRLKACVRSPSDAMELLFVGPSGKPETTRWAKPFGSQNFTPGFTQELWAPPVTLDININLDALPGGTGVTSVLRRMEANRSLDVHIRQNTAVDFLRLEMEVCEVRSPLVFLIPATRTNTVVTFSDPPTFGAAGGVKITCTPPSGSTFPLGTTLVRCLAEDAQGQTARGCFQVVVSQIAFNDRLEITAGPNGPTNAVPLGDSATFTVAARGRGPLTYQWLHNGALIPGATNETFTISPVRAVDGGRYTVLVRDGKGVLESPAITLTPGVPPLPDSDFFLALANGTTGDFTNRITGAQGIGRGSTRGASAEAGEPDHAGYPAVASKWLTWQPELNGIGTLETLGSGFDSRLTVYRLRDPALAPALNNLERIRANDNISHTNHNSRLSFNVRTNLTYFIAIDVADIVRGPFLLAWSTERTPQKLPEISFQPGPRAVALGDRVTLDLGLAVDGTASSFKIQWFRNGTPITGATNPSLALAKVELPQLGQYQAELIQTYANGDERLIRTDPADLQFHRRSKESDADILATDRLSDLQRQIARRPRRAALAGGSRPKGLSAGISGQQIYRSDYCSRETREPLHCGQTSERTTWYALIADTDGVIDIDTVGSDYDTVLAVYYDTVGDLDPYNGLQEVTCSDDISTTQTTSRVQFCASALNTYYVAVAGKANATGLCVLNYAMSQVIAAATCEPLQVTCPPQSGLHSARPGSTVKFSAKVSGTQPVGYAWFKDGSFLQNSVAPELVLNNVQASQAGRYGLALTNASGIHYSDIAVLEIDASENPKLGYEIPCDGGLRLIVYGDDKTLYQIEESPDLKNWSILLTAHPTGGKLEQVLLPTEFRSYRARVAPAR